jgi:cyclopropane fatty-acyl-phospholipid synthase-like methyltransferase
VIGPDSKLLNDPREIPLPDEELQRTTCGWVGDDALREGEQIYEAFRALYEIHAGPLSQAEVLDFGCGWGRVYRFFLQEVPSLQMLGVDVNQERIDFCNQSMPWCDFSRIEPSPPITSPPQAFNLIYAYSVFSHLPEDLHWAWLKEFQRILKPGGLLVLTTRKRSFIEESADALMSPDWLARYDRGEFCFDASYEPYSDIAERFGEACIPESYVRKQWSELFEVLEYRDDLLGQSVIVCRAAPSNS